MSKDKGLLDPFSIADDAGLGSGEDSPDYLLAWLERFPTALGEDRKNAIRRFCTDRQLTPFWDWLSSIQPASDRGLKSSLAIWMTLDRFRELPGKPANMAPSERAAYFKQVQTHANALIDLLEDTRFNNFQMHPVPDSTLDRPLGNALSTWGDDESDDGHTVAYQVTPDGVYSHHYTYPENVLWDLLRELSAFATCDDYWLLLPPGSSASIRQPRSKGAPTIHFCCHVHEWFSRGGVEIPFPLLATLANVVLDLPPDELVDEEAVRKQVRRYQKRRAEEEKSQDTPF